MTEKLNRVVELIVSVGGLGYAIRYTPTRGEYAGIPLMVRKPGGPDEVGATITKLLKEEFS